jgi:hypothetical protein
MRSIRVVLIGFLVATLATAGACTNARTISRPLAGASPTPTDPVKVLVDAIHNTRATSLTFTIDIAGGGVTMLQGSGAIDAAKRRQSSRMQEVIDGVSTLEQTVTIGNDLYVKDDDDAHWMHADATRIATMTVPTVGDLRDPTGLRSYARAVATVRRAGDGQFEGTLDFTQPVPPDPADLGAPMNLGPPGPVPFTATVDDQHRLTSIVITVPATPGVPAATVTVHFVDFGAPVTVEAPPAAQTVEAPKDRFPTVN